MTAILIWLALFCISWCLAGTFVAWYWLYDDNNDVYRLIYTQGKVTYDHGTLRLNNRTVIRISDAIGNVLVVVLFWPYFVIKHMFSYIIRCILTWLNNKKEASISQYNNKEE